MSYNGSGTFVINSTGQPVVANTVISATVFNALTADLATGLSTCITKDGQTTPTANIPMGSNKITTLAAGTAATDAANLGQVQSTAAKLITVTGTDTITGTMSPALTAYATGQLFYFIANGTNTGAMTINIDGLGAKSITRDGSTALSAGDVISGEIVVVCYDGTRFQMINAANSFGNTTINGTLTVTGNTGLQANVSITSALSVGGVFAVTGASTLTGTATLTANPVLSGGTANGVLYLNGSKVATSGSALTFDGTTLGTGAITAGGKITVQSTSYFVGNATNGYRFNNAADSANLVVIKDDGNVGIGTSSPSTIGVSGYTRLVLGTGSASTDGLTIVPSGTGGVQFTDAANVKKGYLQWDASTGALALGTAGATKATLDSSGSLGLGVTPSATNGTYFRAYEVGKAGCTLTGATVSLTGNSRLYLSNNAYGTYSGSVAWVYGNNDSAAQYAMESGAHKWFNAASGTAGNAISFTQAMTLDASGNLLVGTTTSTLGRLEVVGGAGIRVNEDAAGTKVISIRSAFAGGDPAINVSTNHPLTFLTNNTERARITSGGDLLVGTTSSTARLTVKPSSGLAIGTNGYSGDLTVAGIEVSKFDNNTTTSQVLMRFAINNGGAGQGQINANGALTAAFGTYSDKRLKENIVDLPPQLSNIMALRPVEFDYIASEGGGHQIGFIAQEFEKVYPDAIGERADGMKTLTGWSRTEARMVKALQEAMTRIEKLEAEVSALKGA